MSFRVSGEQEPSFIDLFSLAAVEKQKRLAANPNEIPAACSLPNPLTH